MKVSVVIPCFNEARTVRERVLRARAVRPPDLEWEVVIVDDGSTDGTAEVVHALAKEFPEVKVLPLSSHMGSDAAIRSGFNACSGDVVWVQAPGGELDAVNRALWLEPVLTGGADVVFRREAVLGATRRGPISRDSLLSIRLCMRAKRLTTSAVALLERQPWIGCLAMALVGVCLSAILTASLGVPVPGIHDEFSYLLGADTLASGRLANPVHPMWASLESFHICVRPAYASMYPPAQSLFLALGQILAHPVVGVWISMAALGAAAFWMLDGFVGKGWAILGSSLLLFRLCTVEFHGGIGYWANSYWGGAVAATGGALFLGGLHRFLSSWNATNGFFAAVGLGLLANSRPYEGFVMAIPGLICLVTLVLSRHNAPWRRVLARSLLPSVIALATITCGMAYYNYRTTGNPLTIARAACYQQYAQTPSFLFGRVSAPAKYNHRVLAQFNRVDRTLWEEHRTAAGFSRLTADKLRNAWDFFFGHTLGAPLLLLPWALRSSRGLVLATATIAIELAGYLPVAFSQVHYVAPISVALYLVLTVCLRRIATLRWRRWRVGTWLLVPWLGVTFTQGTATFAEYRRTAADRRHGFQFDRQRVIDSLLARGGKHLVIVRYTDEHADFHGGAEVVYNRASIDRSSVVFAREIADCPAQICGVAQTQGSQNRALLRYFRDRTPWLYRADEATLVPYADRQN